VVTNPGALDGVTDFYYDGWREIEERDGADALAQQYVYGIGIDEPLVIDRNLDGDNSATGPGDRRLFYHQNTLGSVFALTDATGAVVEGYQYDAYGRQTVFGPGGNGVVDFGGDDVVSVGGTSAQGNPFLFTGRRLDAETGLYYFRLRYLNAEQGRFVSRDPLGTWNDSLGNAYTYAEGNPINWVDPYGLNAISDYFGDVATTFGGYMKGMGGALKGVGEFFYYTGAGIGSDFADLVDPNGNVFDLRDRKYYQKKRDQIVDGLADLIYDPRGTAARWRDEKIKALANALDSGDLSKAGEVLGGAATEAGLAVDAAVKLPSAGVQIGRATVQAGRATAQLTRAAAQSVQRATSRIRQAINRMQCRAGRGGFPTRAALTRQLAVRNAINVANQMAAIFDEAIKALKKNKISPEEMDFILKNLDEIANKTLDDMIKPNEVPGMVRDGFIRPAGTPEPNPLFRAVWDEANGVYRIIEDNAPGAPSSPPASPISTTVPNAPAVSPNASTVANPGGGATSGAGPGSTVIDVPHVKGKW
jgi:RHS repeat-associated protein